MIKKKSSRYWRELTDSSVLMTVLIPLISLIFKVGHSHGHFWNTAGEKNVVMISTLSKKSRKHVLTKLLKRTQWLV